MRIMKKKNYIKPETNSVAIQAQTFFATSLTKFELKQAAELYYEEKIEEYREKDGSIWADKDDGIVIDSTSRVYVPQ